MKAKKRERLTSEYDAEVGCVRKMLARFDDVKREGLQDTPLRYMAFLDEFINDDKDFEFTTFDAEGQDQMIVQLDIPFYSLCEHHLAPFYGKAHVAYIPNTRIVGLSKLARTVDYYARNFQNQERITTQVAERLQNELQPVGVAVVLKATHLCMSMRGIQKPNTWTLTSKLLGAFKDDPTCRQEFMQIIQNR